MKSIIRYSVGVADGLHSYFFEGLEILVKEFKEVIAEKHGFKIDEVRILNSDSRVEYDDKAFIPKETTVNIAKKPVPKRKKLNQKQEMKTIRDESKMNPTIANETSMTEEEKLLKIVADNEFEGAKYDIKKKSLFPNYVCHLCNIPGHLIQNCPKLQNRKDDDEPIRKIRHAYGIPKNFIKEGKLQVPELPNVTTAKLDEIEGKNKVSYPENSIEKEELPVPSSFNEMKMITSTKLTTEEDRIEMSCLLCNELQHDSVEMSCCKKSGCDMCLMIFILEKNMCPLCKKEGATVLEMSPNEALRLKIKEVTTYKPLKRLATPSIDERPAKKRKIVNH